MSNKAIDPALLEEELGRLDAEELLPDATRRQILAQGASVMPTLLGILGGTLQGSAPVHAATLLGALGATEAIETLLGVLRRTGCGEWVHDAAIGALKALGAAVLEPALAAYGKATDADHRCSLAFVLAGIGVMDERVFQVLLGELRSAPEWGAGQLAAYGDARAIPHLVEAVDAFDLHDAGKPDEGDKLLECAAAIRSLGGKLSRHQEDKVAQARKPMEWWKGDGQAAKDGRAFELRGGASRARRRKHDVYRPD